MYSQVSVEVLFPISALNTSFKGIETEPKLKLVIKHIMSKKPNTINGMLYDFKLVNYSNFLKKCGLYSGNKLG